MSNVVETIGPIQYHSDVSRSDDEANGSDVGQTRSVKAHEEGWNDNAVPIGVIM